MTKHATHKKIAHNHISKPLKQTVLSLALTGILGSTAVTSAHAETVQFSVDGLFTMVNQSGFALQNSTYPYYADPTWGYGFRTPISGSMQFDTVTGAGVGTINPFNFLNAGQAVPHDFTLQAVGDGAGGPGSFIIGNMLFDWNGNNNIAVEIVLDGSGFFTAYIDGLTPGETVSGVGATPATDAIRKGQFPIGPTPIATTTIDTDGTVFTGDDGVGGSQMDNGPFEGFNFNFDFTSMTNEVIVVPAIPIPATVWLFGSGLLGLVGVARRKCSK